MLVTQSCPTLWDPMDCSLPVSSVHEILQARILECIATPVSRDLPNPGIEPGSPVLQADSLPFEPLGFMSYLGSDQSFASALGGTPGKSHSPCISYFPAANGTDNNDACLIELLWGLSR